jgi:hypothetical protein
MIDALCSLFGSKNICGQFGDYHLSKAHLSAFPRLPFFLEIPGALRPALRVSAAAHRHFVQGDRRLTLPFLTEDSRDRRSLGGMFDIQGVAICSPRATRLPSSASCCRLASPFSAFLRHACRSGAKRAGSRGRRSRPMKTRSVLERSPIRRVPNLS